jgi:hypothetical protein
MNDIWDTNDGQYTPEEPPAPDEFSYLHSEVVRRIEKAKLYEAFLKAELFQPGSADPSIIEEVNAEFRQYAIVRIETLMGLRQDDGSGVTAFSLPFTEDEVSALKAVASRMIAQKQAGFTHAAAPKAAPPPMPKIQPVTMAQTQPTRQARRTAPAKTAPSRRRSANVSKTGQDLSQAHNPNAIPMPSQDMMNAHITAQAGRMKMAGNSEDGASQMLQMAIALAQDKNKNVKED